ncbi:hypothetical protein DRN74_03025 [Candidatus Micrarchaeota archaeon]|nr:MAG: hypothetical protein DRN74_03025 [Candidatus Micrarchaeota archaeon]
MHMERLTLLMVDPFVYPFMGGIEKYLYELSRRLARKHDVHIIASKWNEDDPLEEEIEGIHIHRLNSFLIRKLPYFLPPPYNIPFGFQRRLRKILKSERPDFIHLHNRFFLSYDSVIFWKRIYKIPLFLTLHNARPVGIDFITDTLGQLFDESIGKIVMKSADMIIGNSEYTLQITVPEGFPESRTRVLYNGIDTKKYRKVRNKVKEELGCENLMLTVARFQPQKGIKYVIDSLPQIRKEEPDFKALIIGRGPEEHMLKRRVKELNMEDKVIFITHFISEKELIAYYSAADVFVLPSLYEPFGLVFTEAMSCETVPIGTFVGGIPEVIGEVGSLIPPKNEKAVAKEVIKYFSDKKLARREGKKGRKRAERYFDWEKITKRMESYYFDYLRGVL